MDPKETITQSVERLREIVWWNSGATRLHEVVANPEEVPRLMVEMQGPFIERVQPPAPYTYNELPERWIDTAARLAVDTAMRDTVLSVLFRSQPDLSLYHHQGRALEMLGWQALQSGRAKPVTIITVPTATGKTESFLIPVLDTCSQSRRQEHFRHNRARAKLRGLFLYPMKTLAVDQVNRFVRYLHALNQRLVADNLPPVRLGIWDGDTPHRVGGGGEDGENGRNVGRDTPARGLRCPVCDNPLLYRGTLEVGCKSHNFDWLSLTRQSIERQGVDLLVTNPEAIEYLLANPNQQAVLASDALRYIVVDEAHTWTGVEGSSFGLLLMRLRSRYMETQPRVVLASATVAEPRKFAAQLLQVSLDDVAEVDFRSLLQDYLRSFGEKQPQVDYRRIPATTAHQVLALLVVSDQKTDVWAEVVREMKAGGICAHDEEVDRAAAMAGLLGLANREGNMLLLSETGRHMVRHIANEDLMGLELERAVADLSEHPPFIREWADLVADRVPELLDLVSRFLPDGTSFIHENKLVGYIQEQVGLPDTGAREILLTLLSLGRVADLLFDKYHTFLKPLGGITYCPECRTVQRTQCAAGHQTYPLVICDDCHTPGVIIPATGGGAGRVGKNAVITRFLTGCGEYSDRCRCKSGAGRTSEPFMHYQTFASYLVSTVPALLSSRKMLLFADGRGLVDLLVDVTQSLEYSLVADRLIAFHLLTQPDSSMEAVEAGLIKILFQIYMHKTPLKVLRDARGQGDETQNLLRELDQATSRELYSLLRWARKGRLFDPALVTFDAIDLTGNPVEKALIHVLLSELVTAHREQVDDDKIPALPVDKLRDRLAGYTAFRNLIDQGLFNHYLGQLKARYGLVEQPGEKGQLMLALPDQAKGQLRLRIPEQTTYCLDCHRGFPAVLNHCAHCGSSWVMVGNRVTGSGYLPNPVDSGAPYALDHWAHDIVSPALHWHARAADWDGDPVKMADVKDGIDRVVILSHRAGVPMLVRGAIETGFRDHNPPTVNVVAATPTMEMGIDIGTLDCVGQLGIPSSKASYSQRVGRTGRKMTTPSLIFVIIRNEHAVDGFYFGDLENRFLNRPLAPIRVPHAPTGILATHVMAEVLHAVSQLSGRYGEYYVLAQGTEKSALLRGSVEHLFRHLVKNHIRFFCADVKNHIVDVRQHLVRVFGHMEGFEPDQYLRFLFAGNDSLLATNLLQFFKRLHEIYEVSKVGDVVRSFVDSHWVLLQLFGTLDLAPRFRGGGTPVPIMDLEGRSLMVQSAPYALRENAPGEFKNTGPNRGALWRVEGRGFQIHYVIVHPPALTQGKAPVRICENHDRCEMPFHPYPPDVVLCPFCNTPLRKVEVYEYAYGVGKAYKAPPFNRIIETTAFVQSHVEEE